MSVHCKLSSILGGKRIKMAELVRMTGVSSATVNAMYHDRVKKIDYSVLNRICKALNCSVGELIIYVPDEE
ncbi:MAG: helix-turn-helix transcriptional regulator [Clostridiales bacterium]|nr:helix-turn-helix transcriptional regulator [Clostridiales bacterium]